MKRTLEESYVPPAVWQPTEVDGAWGRESLKALSGEPWKDEPLPVGSHPLQLYSLGTPNGVKVTVMLEELGVDYDAWLVNIREGEPYTSGFMAVNPNSHIPCMVDRSDPAAPVNLFESCAILLHLAEKYGKFLPTSPVGRGECISWLFWQAGAGPYCGIFNIYYFYSADDAKHKESIDRWTQEVKRQLTVLNHQLKGRKFICGDEPTIADFAVFPWIRSFKSREKIAAFVSLHEYAEVMAWLGSLEARPGVRRGVRVNAPPPMHSFGLKERHSKNDFEAAAYQESNL